MTIFFLILLVAAQIATIVRVLLGRHHQPASRMAWVVVILLAPVVGVVAYLLFGEIEIGRQRTERVRAAEAKLPALPLARGDDSGNLTAEVPPHYAHLFRVGRSISGFAPIGGNSGRLLEDSDAAIDAMVTDIDAATDHVHVMFYIWLADNNGLKMKDALVRAAARGVTCRVMVDDLGSRKLVRSEHWTAMSEAGVRVADALPIHNLLLHPFKGRVDLRNHRKIVVIDNEITYCGSQNCADPDFLVKAKFAPWVDAMIRFTGPVARQNQILFAGDWLGHVDDDAMTAIVNQPITASRPGIPAQVIGTGPTLRYTAMPEIFEAMMYTADRELVVTTPYYVPDEPLQAALCSSARRGVETTLVLPERNDSWIVAAASRSYYAELLEAGVKLFEYRGGLLHTKSITLDGDVTLIGSANVDRRSFQLNYENNILFYDPVLTGTMRARQQSYVDSASEVSLHDVSRWSDRKRIYYNAVAMFGPVL